MAQVDIKIVPDVSAFKDALNSAVSASLGVAVASQNLAQSYQYNDNDCSGLNVSYATGGLTTITTTGTDSSPIPCVHNFNEEDAQTSDGEHYWTQCLTCGNSIYFKRSKSCVRDKVMQFIDGVMKDLDSFNPIDFVELKEQLDEEDESNAVMRDMLDILFKRVEI